MNLRHPGRSFVNTRAGRFIIAAFLIGLSRLVDASVSNQTLTKGQSATIEVEYEIGDVAVANTSICDFLVSGGRRSIYLNARGGGETSVTLWDTGGKRRDEFEVRVVTSTLKDVIDRARDEFGDIEGVEIGVRNGKVEMTGEIADPEDFRRLDAVDRADPRMRNRVRLSGDVIGEIASAVRGAVETAEIDVRSIRDRVVLDGIAYSEADRRRAVEIAKIYHPDVMDLIEVRESGRRIGRGDLIELEFHMMEIKKSALRELGVNWAPGSMPDGGAGTATASGGGILSSIGDMGKTLLGFVFQLVPKLKFIRERGDGRVLENPSIIVKSGEAAQIFSGSEVPYYKNDEVQFKKVGIDIKAEPVKLKDGVDLRLTATLSAPSADIRGAVDTNTVSTTAICPFGQSIVLGNIVRNGDVKMKNRVPANVDTSSALFTLFLSKDFQSNRSEFVIFVTPRLIGKPDAATAKLYDFKAMEEAMMRDRSKKEYGAYVARRGGSESPKPKPAQRGRRKWR